MHWADGYIGKQWDPLGDGESTFNCWTFAQTVQRVHYSRELPDVEINARNNLAIARACVIESTKDNWVSVVTPLDGDIVLLARASIPVHVGTWVRAGYKSGVLHCVKGLGVVHQTPLDLRAAGWGKLTYFRWVPT
jgi:cell wall-associated NlpC family hydrolase